MYHRKSCIFIFYFFSCRYTFFLASFLGHPINIPRERNTGFFMVLVNDYRVASPFSLSQTIFPKLDHEPS